MATQTVTGKYIFLDIVGYSHQRTVEAQTDIIDAMNNAVRKAITSLEIAKDRRVLIPTGDGVCVALLDVKDPFDIHLQLALRILELIDKYNQSQKDKMRQFQVRVGVNENIDNLITDINGNKNVAGAGITEAQRIMDQGNGGNILVGRTVFEQLRQRENYMTKFRKYPVIIKHNVKMDVYQFIDFAIPYLNSEESHPGVMGILHSHKKKLSAKIKPKEWKDKIKGQIQNQIKKIKK
ncbi:MAG TPA: adenylate/guanylate cyclase domain-containing protein [Candidatus Nanoarchaeia archaeon]|nr:adenylate/guanylate cyclase domain-containing protein [Candidatus Nanoarchaeia archaeon]